MNPITNISNHPALYVAALNDADTLEKLINTLRDWREIAFDACEIALRMTEDDFAEWRIGLAKERAGDFAGEKFARKYGALMQPEILFKVAILAHRFHVPWGCAYLRMKEIQKGKGYESA